MTKEDQEPVERLEEILFHPADKTFNRLHDQGLATKKTLRDERQELTDLLNRLKNPPPKKGTKEYQEYTQTQKEIEALKERISKTHNELMEILKNEERISREIQDKQP